MSALRLARAHRLARLRLVRQLDRFAAGLWARVDKAAIVSSWASLAPTLTVAVAVGQRQAVQQAGPYIANALAAQGLAAVPVHLVADALAGIASDGRPLDTLLDQPAIAALTAIKAGATPDRALFAGQTSLRMIVGTQVTDAGRVADGVALTAQKVAGYYRMLTPPSCSRCIVLAGTWYAWNAGFERHPRCDCVHVPAAEDAPGDIRTDPKAYFDSLDQADQDRIFTVAGAQAIRDGSDIGRVVNARRGMYTADGRQFTREATTKRGTGRKIRIMPEQIYRDAGGNRAEAIRLLRLHGYIV